LAANTSGLANVAVGYYALNANTTGYYNVAVGRNALILNTTADSNTAIGDLTLAANTTGYYNTAIGRQALQANITASYNTAVGHQAGNLLTTGSKNTILGRYNGNQGGLDIRTANNYIVLSDGDGNPLISTNSTRSVALNGAVPQTGTGITFPATQNASSNANTLDDYEEGTWTPVLSGNGGATGQTYTLQTGEYTKVGNLVTVRGAIQLSAAGTLSGTYAVIGGLPFTVSNTFYPGGITFTLAAYFASVIQTINAYANQTTTQMWICGSSSTGGTPLNNLNKSIIGNSTFLIFHGHYYV